MASMDVTCADGWLSMVCQGRGMMACGSSYNAPSSIPNAMAAAVRAAAAHVCGQPDDTTALLLQASAELNPCEHGRCPDPEAHAEGAHDV